MTRTLRLLPVAVAAALLVISPDARADRAAGPVGQPVPVSGSDRQIVPLAGAKPGWLTPDLEALVLASEGVPVSAPKDAPLPGTVGIRPGSWMVSPAGCTMNFVFASAGMLGIGTAGHCVDSGEEVVLLTLTPGSNEPVLVNIGSAVLSRDGGIGEDFALVAIRPSLHPWVSATKAVWGGPCGSYSGTAIQGIFHYGHGIGLGTGGTPRGGIGLYFEREAFFGASPAIFGDSGSAVRITDLRAAGNLTHLVIDSQRPGATIAGTTIDEIHRIASGWTMVDSPNCPGGGAGGDPGGGDPGPDGGSGRDAGSDEGDPDDG